MVTSDRHACCTILATEYVVDFFPPATFAKVMVLHPSVSHSVHRGGHQAHTQGGNWGVWLGGVSRPTPVGVCPGPGQGGPKQMATAAGGTHPTGMHSCLVSICRKKWHNFTPEKTIFVNLSFSSLRPLWWEIAVCIQWIVTCSVCNYYFITVNGQFPSLMEITVAGGVNKCACFTIICTSADGERIRTPIRTCLCAIHFVRLQPLNLPFCN